MTFDSLMKQVLVVCPDALFEVDDDGEITITSGFRCCPGDTDNVESVGEETA